MSDVEESVPLPSSPSNEVVSQPTSKSSFTFFESAGGARVAVLSLTGTVLSTPPTDLTGAAAPAHAVVVDCREARHEQCVKNVAVVAELIARDEVEQVWYPSSESCHLLELRSRLLKSLRRQEVDKETTPGTARQRVWEAILQKVSCHERTVAREDAFQVGRRLNTFLDLLVHLPEMAMAHRGLVGDLMRKCRSLKRSGLFDKGEEEQKLQEANQQVEAIKPGDETALQRHTAANFAYRDTRRPTKRAFNTLKYFVKGHHNPKVPKQEEKKTATESIRRRCYICKAYRSHVSDEDLAELDVMCEACRKLNEDMKKEELDLTGKYAVVTGARIKIGYEIVLRLLRNGCFVIGTSRFPCDALHRFEQEPDFASFSSRLRLCYLDLEDVSSVSDLLRFTSETVPHLDMLINNAAQTIFRPPQYFKGLKEKEDKLLENLHEHKHMIGLNGGAGEISSTTKPAPRCLQWMKSRDEGTSETNGLQQPNFPPNLLDEHGEQVDLRDRNSWTLNLPEVPLRELLQVLTVNAVGPFLLISRLKPLLAKSPHERKFIVNVSAMEGQFSRMSKGHRHPHTNMAKAALNMMTRTSGLEYQMDGIYMTAVDTGWVTDERPFHQSTHEKDTRDFVVPLDCEDGAARVLHPVMHGLAKKGTTPFFAVFLKDFKVHPW